MRRREFLTLAGGAAVAGSLGAGAGAGAQQRAMPIVFQIGIDPIQVGLVASLSRPGGNVTGVTTLAVEVAPKRLELMREMLPSATAIALLVNPTNPILAEALSADIQAAGRRLGL